MITFTPIPREAVSSKRKTIPIKKKNSNPFIITPLSHGENLSEQQIEDNILHVRQLLSKLTQLKIKKQKNRIQKEIKKLQQKKIKKYQQTNQKINKVVS